MCLFSLILPHLLWPLRAAEFGHVVKMIILLSDIGCLFEKCVCVCGCMWPRVCVAVCGLVCVCVAVRVCRCLCVSVSACGLVVVLVCCHELP